MAPAGGLLALLAGMKWTEEGWSSFDIKGHRADPAVETSVPLTVLNRGDEQIRLANCDENHVVEPGGELSLSIKDKFGFWIVPNEAQWNCKTGPFDFFAVGADLEGPDLKLGVGVDVVPDDFKENEEKTNPEEQQGQQQQQEQSGQPEQEEKEETPPSSTAVLGVVLSTNTHPLEGVRAVACFDDSCTKGLELDAAPESLTLHIIGKNVVEENKVTNFLQNHWFGHHHHGHHHHGHHHHGHHHHGHHHHGHHHHGHHHHGHGHW